MRILLSAFPLDDRTDLEAEVVDDLRALGLRCAPAPNGTWVARADGGSADDAPHFFVTRDPSQVPEVLESGAVDAIAWPRDRATLPYRILNALRLAEERAQTSFLRRLLDACPEAILVTSENGEIVFANEPACAIDDARDRTHHTVLRGPTGEPQIAMFVGHEARRSERRLKTG